MPPDDDVQEVPFLKTFAEFTEGKSRHFVVKSKPIKPLIFLCYLIDVEKRIDR